MVLETCRLTSSFTKGGFLYVRNQARQSFVAVRAPALVGTNIETVTRFDGIALAELCRAGVDLVWEARPNDTIFREKVTKAYADAQLLLKDVEGAEPILEILSRPFPGQEV